MRVAFLLPLLLLAASPAWAQDGSQITNQTAYSYSDGSGGPTMSMLSARSTLMDPRGLVLGCDGTPLPSYAGFRIGLYEPDPADPTGAEVKGPAALTPTALPAAPGQPAGVAPNVSNANPFSLSDTEGGRFSLLLDAGRGQLDAGRTFILLLSPPSGSPYRQRRIRITIGPRDGTTVDYTAASLDGEPISGMGGAMSGAHTMLLRGAETDGSEMAALSLTLTDCPQHELQISKTGDQATAEPGDSVVYRVSVANTTGLPLGGIQIRDTLPLGFVLRDDSVRGAVGGVRVPFTLTRSGATTLFDGGALTLLPDQTLTLAYAALLTPDALRGDGRNSAVVSANALMITNGKTTSSPVTDGPTVWTVQPRQGLLTDTGTILGRVWVDRSRDGEQQSGEPGLGGAVVLLDDSTRIVADLNGLFSLGAVPAGYHSAVLDMESVPGYVLARGRFRERRSQSRLIHITPGGMVRLNFGVVPASPTKGGAR